MSSAKVNPAIVEQVIKKIDLIANKGMPEYFLEDDDNENILSNKEIEISVVMHHELLGKLSPQGQAFLSGAVGVFGVSTLSTASEDWVTSTNVNNLLKHVRVFRQQGSYTFVAQHARRAKMFVPNINQVASLDTPSEELLDEKISLEYIDAIIEETKELNLELSEINEKYDAFLKTEPVQYIPHVKRRVASDV